jgi:hypothetical protein
VLISQHTLSQQARLLLLQLLQLPQALRLHEPLQGPGGCQCESCALPQRCLPACVSQLVVEVGDAVLLGRLGIRYGSGRAMQQLAQYVTRSRA